MKVRYILPAMLLACGLLSSCQDDVSDIGGSLTKGEVTITVDSLETDMHASTVYYDSFDGRNVTKLLGRLRVPEYGIFGGYIGFLPTLFRVADDECHEDEHT